MLVNSLHFADILLHWSWILLSWNIDEHMGYTGSVIYLSLSYYFVWFCLTPSIFQFCSTLCSKSTCISAEVERLQRWRKRLQDRLWWLHYDDIIVGSFKHMQFWSSCLLNSLIAFITTTYLNDANVILEYIVISIE